MTVDKEIIYVGDPMCSWCWGFSPVLKRIEAEYGLPVRLEATQFTSARWVYGDRDKIDAFVVENGRAVVGRVNREVYR